MGKAGNGMQQDDLPFLIVQDFEGCLEHQFVTTVGDVGEGQIVFEIRNRQAIVPFFGADFGNGQIPGDREHPGHRLAHRFVEMGGGADLQVGVLGHVQRVVVILENRQGKGKDAAFGGPVELLEGRHVIGGDAREQGFIYFQFFILRSAWVRGYHHTQKQYH